MPQLGKRGLDALPHLSQQVLFLRGIGPCENQHARFLGPLGGSCLAPITEIAEGDATLDPFEQGQYRGLVSGWGCVYLMSSIFYMMSIAQPGAQLTVLYPMVSLGYIWA